MFLHQLSNQLKCYSKIKSSLKSSKKYHDWILKFSIQTRLTDDKLLVFGS